jgi:hypothetical protein
MPGAADAQDRAWDVVAAAFAERDGATAERRTGRRRAGGRVAAIAVTACVAIAAVALTPPGEAVGDWLRDVVRPAAPHAPAARPSLGALPDHGRLLVVGPTGAWIVQRDGSRRRLGSYDDAAFSPHGLFVAVTRGRMLAAVDPRGAVRWSLTRDARVTHPAWSPDGFRIAYRSGRRLRVVYGDGARDRVLAPRSAAVTPAWRPGAAHRLAFVTSGGAVALRDADSGRQLWRTPLGSPVRALAWSPDGRRLLAVGPNGVTLIGAGGRVLRTVAMASGARAVAARWLPSSRTFFLLRTDAGARSSEVLRVRPASRRPARTARRLIAVPGRLAGMLASPAGHALLLDAPDADQWLIVRIGAKGHISARSGVARQFDPAARSARPDPRPQAWIR